MPPQLARGLKARPRGKYPPRPIAEQLQAVSIVDLKVPRDYKIYTMPNVGLKYPFLANVRLNYHSAEFIFPPLHRGQPGKSQTFNIYPVNVGYGTRHYFQCDCDRGAAKLYLHNGYLACKHCHHVRMASQATNKARRTVLLASRLQSILDNAKMYKRTRERLTKLFGEKVMRAEKLWK
jgi:hypothetical protein